MAASFSHNASRLLPMSLLLCLHLKNIEENIVSATFEEGHQIQQIIYVICPQLVLIDEVNVRNEKNMTV
jgi:hypothetical protein